jgi:methylenetetrahydrofolate reductase (NADPH)
MHAFDTGLPIRGHCRPDPMGTILNTFRDAIRSKDFVVTAELPLPAGQSMADLQENLSVLQSVVDAVQVGCDEGTDAQIAELAAGRIAREAGVDAIVQPRRGEKLPSTLRGRVKGVFDTKVVQLLTIARRIGENSRFVDGELLLGCLVTAFRPQENWDASRVTEKIDAGAGFLQTRPCADIGLIHDYVSRLVSQRLTHRAAVIVGLPLLLSEARARSIVDRHPGTIVPEALIATLAGASDPRREGIAALAGMLSELAATPGVSGVAIVDVNDVEAVAEAIRLSGVLDQAGSG